MPTSHGGLGPGGQAGVDVLYAPNRVREPLKRHGPRGSNQWESIPWAQALDEVAKPLAELRAAGEPHRLLVMSGRERGIMADLWTRFCRVYGTPNHLSTARSGPAGTISRAMALATGVPDLPAYDLANSAYVVSLGSGMLESGCLGTYATRAVAEVRQRAGRRGKLLQIEPTFSLTAAAADEWVAVRPGSLDVLAFALANVLVREKLHDARFLDERVFGWESFSDVAGVRHSGLRQQLEAFTPEAVASRCGIEPQVIVRLAREMGTHQPAVVVFDERSVATTNGLSIARAAIALNAVLGALGRAGGMLLQDPPPYAPWPAERLDAIANRSLDAPTIDSSARDVHPLATAIPEALAEAIAAGKPYKPAAALLYYTNPLASLPAPERVRSALAEVPLVVSFSPFLDGSTELADYVLPDHTYLERWEDGPVHPSIGFPLLSLRQPAVEPVHTTRHTGDVVLELGRRIGGTVAESLPWSDFKHALQQKLCGLAAAGQSGDDFVDELCQRGYWAAAEVCRPEQSLASLRTPSSRWELFSQAALESLLRVQTRSGRTMEDVLAAAGGPPSIDAACLGLPVEPRWVGDPAAYPYMLVTYRPVSEAVGGPASGLLSELGDPLTGARWGGCVEVNPRTARSLGVEDGEPVWLESPAGRHKLQARVFGGVPPDVVRVPLGLDPPGAETTPRCLLALDSRCELGRVPGCSVRVRLTKVTV